MHRVLVIGARRRRQGIGGFVARWFHTAGAEVAAIVGTSRRSVEAAREELREHGIRARGYTALGVALQEVRPGIVAICSPYRYHAGQLEQVAASGANCLCEKPLWWGPGPDRIGETARLVDLYARSGLYLATITQWPYTLPFYFEIYPQLEDEVVETFEMSLSPISAGPEMVLDAAPHALSMIQHLVGPGHLEGVRARYPGGQPDRLEMGWNYRHSGGKTSVTLRFSRCEKPPRPASYALNGHEARRKIRLPGYEFVLEGSGGSVPMEDPLGRLVNDYLGKAARKAAPDRVALVEGLRGLETLLSVAEQEVKRCAPPRAGSAAGERGEEDAWTGS